MKFINLPICENDIKALNCGDTVMLSGTIYTARDAAHEKLFTAINNNEKLPFDLKNETIYYVGACPAKPNEVIGSCGPTTGSRMDKYTPLLLDTGLKVMIGKGKRGKTVIESIKKNSAVYFSAIGGAGALYADCITACELIAYSELLSEAIYKMKINNFPAIVAIDCRGNSIY